jgi:Short repeat of unknown function (DUF308)
MVEGGRVSATTSHTCYSVSVTSFTQLLARNWWLFLLRGVAAITFGVLSLIWPGISLGTFILLFGAYALVHGVFAPVATIVGGGNAEHKVLVRGVVADAGAPGEFTQRKLKTLSFTLDFQRRLDDRSAQIAPMKPTLLGAGFWLWTQITFVAPRLSQQSCWRQHNAWQPSFFAGCPMLTTPTFGPRC